MSKEKGKEPSFKEAYEELEASPQQLNRVMWIWNRA